MTKQIDKRRIDEAIHMLKTYTDASRIEPFIAILEAMSINPDNEPLLDNLYKEFQGLGIDQGAVLTYAPSIYNLIVNDPFND